MPPKIGADIERPMTRCFDRNKRPFPDCEQLRSPLYGREAVSVSTSKRMNSMTDSFLGLRSVAVLCAAAFTVLTPARAQQQGGDVVIAWGTLYEHIIASHQATGPETQMRNLADIPLNEFAGYTKSPTITKAGCAAFEPAARQLQSSGLTYENALQQARVAAQQGESYSGGTDSSYRSCQSSHPSNWESSCRAYLGADQRAGYASVAATMRLAVISAIGSWRDMCQSQTYTAPGPTAPTMTPYRANPVPMQQDERRSSPQPKRAPTAAEVWHLMYDRMMATHQVTDPTEDTDTTITDAGCDKLAQMAGALSSHENWSYELAAKQSEDSSSAHHHAVARLGNWVGICLGRAFAGAVAPH